MQWSYLRPSTLAAKGEKHAVFPHDGQHLLEYEHEQQARAGAEEKVVYLEKSVEPLGLTRLLVIFDCEHGAQVDHDRTRDDGQSRQRCHAGLPRCEMRWQSRERQLEE